MTVKTTTQQLTRNEALAWIDARGIERLPGSGEVLDYSHPGVAFCAETYTLERAGGGFVLTKHVIEGKQGCSHEFYFFGDQVAVRRCVHCSKLEG